jgi:hypothetical protein
MLIADIKKDKELKKFLFKPDSFEAIEGTINSPLACFANFTHVNALKEEEKQIVKPFELSLGYDNKQKIFSGDSQYQFVISYLKAKNPDIFPATTFSELHRRALNIRNVVIPRKDSKRFFWMGVEYKRIGGKDSCAGIIHSITSKLDYNIWQSYNYTINSSENYDKGNLVFLLEDLSNIWKKNDDQRTRNAYLEEAEANITEILSKSNFKNITFDHLAIAPLPDPLAVKRTFEIHNEERSRKDYKYDVFISYSHVDEAYVKDVLVKVLVKNGLEVHLDRDVFNFGDPIDSTLLSNILNSREMCVVLSKDSISSEWVTTEWGAAWILNKNLVPIILKKDFLIPDRLKRLSSIVDGEKIDQLELYAKQLIEKKFAAEANRFSHFYTL